MGQPAARVTDQVIQLSPHCHAPIHPAAPVPTPVAHPPVPQRILSGSPNVFMGGLQAARQGDQTAICQIPGCMPGGPGVIARGSATVLINGLPAARVNDPSSHPTCAKAIIPAGTGMVLGPGLPTVIIGD